MMFERLFALIKKEFLAIKNDKKRHVGVARYEAWRRNHLLLWGQLLRRQQRAVRVSNL